jgi:hypothetical protein
MERRQDRQTDPARNFNKERLENDQEQGEDP